MEMLEHQGFTCKIDAELLKEELLSEGYDAWIEIEDANGLWYWDVTWREPELTLAMLDEDIALVKAFWEGLGYD